MGNYRVPLTHYGPKEVSSEEHRHADMKGYRDRSRAEDAVAERPKYAARVVTDQVQSGAQKSGVGKLTPMHRLNQHSSFLIQRGAFRRGNDG